MQIRTTIIVACTAILSSCSIVDKSNINTSLTINCGNLPQFTSCKIDKYANAEETSIRGTILADNTVYVNGSLSFNNQGTITAVGCFTPPANHSVINCAGSIVTPGFINAHDHLNYNHLFPGGENAADYQLCQNPKNAFSNPACQKHQYDRRNQWRKGLNDKKAIESPRDSDNKAKAYNELRHVLAGLTTIAGSGGHLGLARNIDQDHLKQNLTTDNNKKVKYDTFPMGDFDDVTGRSKGNCNYPKLVKPDVLNHLTYLAHVAEGIDAYAQNELDCLLGHGEGSVALQAPNVSVVHAIATTPKQAEQMSKAKMSVVWSPRSNISLYGNTAPVVMFDHLGLNISLATDWIPSGSSNMLREISCAVSYNKTHLNNHFSAFDIWQMVTINSAKALGVDDQLGRIAQGYIADIAIYKQATNVQNPYEFLSQATIKDIQLVLRGGKPLTGIASLVNKLNPSCEVINNVCGKPRAVCLKETGYTYAELNAHNENTYPLFSCATPKNEPTCTPAKYQQYSGLPNNNDIDGDGIKNNQDNCPTIFNPIRPMDKNNQADYNKNGIGDACEINTLNLTE